MANTLKWHKVADIGEVADGRVKTVTAGNKWLALVHLDGQYSAMENHCPHQRGPLGEGSIECGADGKKWLRCPWHGWDFDPLTGIPPGGFEDSGQQMYPVEVRGEEIYVGVEAPPARQRTVTDVMAETMTNWGIKRVFGMVGHSNLGLAEALRTQAEKGNLKYVGIRHEGAAAFACSGYAKASGKPAACLTIAGPGATNLLTGLWDAKVDRAPVLALTGQVQVQVLGPGVFQDIDLASAFDAVSRFSKTVLESSNHAELMTLACKSAIVERDVAHLIFPDNVQTIAASDDVKASSPEGRVGSYQITPPADALESAIKLLAGAKRPLIVCGYGARNSAEQIIRLAEKLNAPVATTFKAKGLIADSHPLGAGVLGRSGTPIASWFMNESDLILAFGSSFSNHTGITTKRPLIQVDFDRMALGKFHAVTVPVWGEVGITAELIAQRLDNEKLEARDRRTEMAERRRIWRAEKSRREQESSARGISSAAIFAALTRQAPEDAIIAVDVGNNTYSFGRYFECEKQSVLMSGYLGSIGFGFPAAMGAWAATQDFEELRGRKVIAVTGDGGFGQYLGEFTTAVKYGMDITHILLNNGELGKISKEQQGVELPVWETSLHNPNFAAYAKLCGAHGKRVEDSSRLDEAIKEALDFKGPAIVEVISDAELV